MIRIVLWSLDRDGWHRIAAVPVAEHRAAAALVNARRWILPAHRGLVRVEVEPPLTEKVPALAGVAS